MTLILPSHHHKPVHHQRCRTEACHQRTDARWGREHHWHAPAPPFHVTEFDYCVANREQGEPGSVDPALIHWDAQQGIYGGAYSMEGSKWEDGGGKEYAANPWEASAVEQTRVFERLRRREPGAWQETLPLCLDRAGA
jgi:hypothetical protein